MTTTEKKSLKLSESMNSLKEEIHKQKIKKQTLEEQVHAGSNVASTLSSGVTTFFGLISSILNSNKNLPVAGFFLQMFSVIPKYISILTDPKTSISQKVAALTLLGIITALSITAFVVGTFAAAVVGIVASSIATALEGIGLLASSINKYRASKAYDKKNEFNESIGSLKTPEGENFNELLEIRAIELERKLTKGHLSEDEKNILSSERNFIIETLEKKNITIGSDKEKQPALLQELYKKRDDKLAELINTISAFSPSLTIDHNLEEIQTLQNDIQEIDNEIKTITAPIEELARNNDITNEKLAFSVGTLSMAVAGTVLSVIGLLLTVGSVAAPPFVLPALIGFGIVMSTISLIKWSAEKFIEYQDSQLEETKSAAHKESILDEALVGYEHQLSNNIASTSTLAIAPVESSSHLYMSNLMKKAPVDSPSAQQTEPQMEQRIAKTESSPLNQSQYKQRVEEMRGKELPQDVANNNFTPT